MAITKPQSVMGTPDFCSPEQSRDPTSTDIRSDLYSLGCTFYYLLTGKPPFEGAGTYAKMIAHYKEPPPDVAGERDDIPPAVGEILLKLLAKSPRERYQTPAELAAALLLFCGKERMECVTPVGKKSKPGFTSVASSAALPLATELEEGPTAREINSHVSHLRETSEQPAVKSRRWLYGSLLIAIVVGGVTGLVLWMNGKKEGANTTPLEPALHDAKHADSPSPSTTPIAPPKLTALKNKILLLLPAEFAHAEFTNTANALKQRGFAFVTAGPEKQTLDGYQYSSGTKTFVKKYDPDYGVKDISDSLIDSVDGVIVISGEHRTFTPGGAAGADVKRIIETSLKKKKVIGGVGSGVAVLGLHGFLENREASSMINRPKSEAQIKVKAWLEEPKIVTDYPFITSGVIGHAKEFTDEMLKAIANQNPKQ
jgi:serine/threonine-protein kinase